MVLFVKSFKPENWTVPGPTPEGLYTFVTGHAPRLYYISQGRVT